MREKKRGRRDDFSLGVFYIPPELVWNQQQVAHARTSLAPPSDHTRGFQIHPFLYCPENRSITTFKAWYKYCAMTEQQA